MDLLPIILKLSNFEAKVFTFVTCLANFKRQPLGRVEMSLSALAKQVGTSRGSLRRALKSLEEHGLITQASGSPGSNGWITVIHYLDHQDPPGGSPRPHESPQPQPSIDTYAAPIRSEEVSEEEVKRKREVARALELKAVAKEKRSRAAKAAPPHPLKGLVSWDKEKREVRFEEGTRGQGGWAQLDNQLALVTIREKLRYGLTKPEMQEGWGRLNGHLMGNPFKTNPKTLPAIVLNWFETDLRRKNNHPQRGKPLAQRIDEKTRERMNDGIEESSTEDTSFDQQLLGDGGLRFNS